MYIRRRRLRVSSSKKNPFFPPLTVYYIYILVYRIILSDERVKRRRRRKKKGSKNNPRRSYISAHTYYAAVFGQDFVLTGRVDLIANAKDYVWRFRVSRVGHFYSSVLFLSWGIIDLLARLRSSSSVESRWRWPFTQQTCWGCLVLHTHLYCVHGSLCM
jgi:hypothetical protein